MPKPQGTFLQVAKIARIKLRAGPEKSIYRINQSESRRAYLGKFDLWAARNIAYQAYDYGVESNTRGNTVRKSFSKVVDQLSELHEKIDAVSVLHSELREPHFEFKAANHDAAHITASNVLVIAMAAITLLMVLEKVTLNSGKQRF